MTPLVNDQQRVLDGLGELRRRRSILAVPDGTVRRTGMPARIADQVSGEPDRMYRPRRWIPIWLIGFAAALFVVSMAWTPAMAGVSLGVITGVATPLWGGMVALMSGLYVNGRRLFADALRELEVRHLPAD